MDPTSLVVSALLKLIEDLWRRKSKYKWKDLDNYLSIHYANRTFTVESRYIKDTLQKYKDHLGRTAPIETYYGLSDNPALSSLAGHESSSNAFFDKTDALVGIEGPMNHLVPLLTENLSMSKVIFVHGAQGVGKTSLAAAVLRHQSVKSHFKCCVWIEDLRSCELAEDKAAMLMEANATMLWDLTMGEVNSPGRPVKLRTVQLGEAFRLMKEHYLTANNFSWALVLDDAGRADVFEYLQDHLIETRPSVLVTTRVRSLSSSSKDYLKKAQYDSLDFEHVFLSKNDSRTLFCQKMGDTYEDLLKCEKDAFDCIVRRCKGSPLAILATCKLLQYNKEHDVRGDSDAVQWEKLSGRLEEELLSRWHEVSPNGRMINPNMEHLLDVRNNLFYLSIFPLDCPIRCSTMMRLWIAEGFMEQGSQPVQAKVEKTLDKLLKHNVIWEERTSYGRVKTGCVDNLLHQIFISKSKDEEFAMIVADPKESLPENVRYLSFHSRMDNIDNCTSVKRLRSLLVFKTVNQRSLEKLLKKVERLKVLDLQRHLTEEEKRYPPASLKTFPQEILQSKYLRYLSLRGTDVKKIPEGIKDLAYLETLDLRCTLVDQLPDGILKLKALRHLLVSSRPNGSLAVDTDPKRGVKAPSKLGVLTSLQKLCMIELEPVEQSKWWKKWKKFGRVQFLKNLGNLANLQSLGISMLNSADVKLLCSSILKLANLEALRLIAAPGEKIDLSKDDKRKPLKYLQRVHLIGCLGTLPNWILHPDSLVKLVLKGSQLIEDPLQHLGTFLCLKHLELEQAFDVSDMTFKAGKFQQLCFLGLDRFDKLASIQAEEGALPTLERLSLARCKLLTTVPQVIIKRPSKLKCLDLCGMPKRFDTAVKGNEEVRTHMEVKFKDWKDGTLEEVIRLPAHSAGSRSAPHPFMK